MRTVTDRVFSIVFVLAAGLVLGGVSFAQTSKKVKPKPLATPPPAVLTDADIISRASDYDSRQPAATTAASPAGTTTAAKPPVANRGTARRDLDARIKKLEATQTSDYETKQRLLLLNLDILTRAEGRSESLRKQMFDLADKENTIKSRLDQIDFDIRPEQIDRSLQLVGSMHPEEIRESRRKSLEAEQTNLNNLLTSVESSRVSVEASLRNSDELVEKLRSKLEKDIDNSLADAPKTTDTAIPPETPDDLQ